MYENKVLTPTSSTSSPSASPISDKYSAAMLLMESLMFVTQEIGVFFSPPKKKLSSYEKIDAKI